MDTLFDLLMAFAVLWMFLGSIGILWACLTYIGRRRISDASGIALSIMFILSIVGLICAQSFFPRGYMRWLMSGISLLALGLTLIITTICDIRRYYASDVKYHWCMHVLVILAFTAIPAGRALAELQEDKRETYMYRHAEVKTIAYVQFETKEETVMEIVETSNGDVSLPTKQDVERVYLVMTDGTRVHISRRNKSFNYEALYPAGDTISIYNGKLIKLRGYVQLP